ncbi:MAG: hypothetical protein ACFB0C_20780 [Leptolyngbyaceae cyanobacterium]
MTFVWLRPGLTVALLLLATACGRGNAPTAESPSTPSFDNPTVPAAEGTEQTADEATEAEETGSETPTAQGNTNITIAPVDPPQPAVLTAADPQAQINLRSEPSVEARSEGYGLVGDSVTLLKTAATGGEVPWYYVKFPGAEFEGSGAEGWIRGDFIDATGQTTASLQVDTFTIDDLFAVSPAGCGMVLSRQGDISSDFIFANGLEVGDAWMRIDGTMTRFRHAGGSGEPFYGQTTRQQFVSLDGRLQIDTAVTLGASYDEVVEITGGTLTIRQGENQQVFQVVGDAGC